MPIGVEKEIKPCLNPDNSEMQDCAIRHRDVIKLLEDYYVYKDNRTNLDSKDFHDFRIVDIVLARQTIKQKDEETESINKLKDVESKLKQRLP
jgi:hypothetical protein